MSWLEQIKSTCGDQLVMLLNPCGDCADGEYIHWGHETTTFNPFAKSIEVCLTTMNASAD